ncbi:MAG: NAD(+) synthase [Coriobacteriia bacterium]|nr:NAD(+) synthase [Coriobacteriia bacterium]
MPKILPLDKQLENFEQECFTGKDAKRILRAYNACVDQTQDFVKKSGFSDVAIGLSGGVDSSLVAKIAVDAFGAEHVHGIILPGPYSSQESMQDAKQLVENLGISTNTMFINSAYEAIVNSLNLAEFPADDVKIKDITSQNIQSRLRMIVLMAASNEYNWLLLNTANKSEVYTGYSTLYGDMAGGFAPLGDVYKTDVFKMCICKNMQERRTYEKDVDVIPQSIISKPPSAELTDNQTDEASLGIDYPTLDAILHEYVDNKKTANEIVFLGYSEVQVQNVVTKVKRSEYKRHYEPPCAKI